MVYLNTGTDDYSFDPQGVNHVVVAPWHLITEVKSKGMSVLLQSIVLRLSVKSSTFDILIK